MAAHLLDPMTGLTLECELLETTLMDGKTYASMTPIDAPVTIATLDKANGELIELEARWHMSTHFCHVSHSILLHVSSPYISSPCISGFFPLYPARQSDHIQDDGEIEDVLPAAMEAIDELGLSLINRWSE